MRVQKSAKADAEKRADHTGNPIILEPPISLPNENEYRRNSDYPDRCGSTAKSAFNDGPL